MCTIGSTSIAAAKRVGYSPGQVLITSAGPQVRHVSCQSPQQGVYKKYYWCEGCARKGIASVLKNGQWARIDGEASEVHLSNSCRIISGKGRTSVGSGSSVSVIQLLGMYEFEGDNEMVASPDWFDEVENI